MIMYLSNEKSIIRIEQGSFYAGFLPFFVY